MRFQFFFLTILSLLLVALGHFESTTCAQSPTKSTVQTSPSPVPTGCLDCLSVSVKGTPGCAAVKDFNPTTFSDLTSLNTTAAKNCFCALSSSRIWLTSCASPGPCPTLFANAIEDAYNVTRSSICSNVSVVQSGSGTKNDAHGESNKYILVQAVVSSVAFVVLHAFS